MVLFLVSLVAGSLTVRLLAVTIGHPSLKIPLCTGIQGRGSRSAFHSD